MAETVLLELTANGVPIEGESTKTDRGGEGTIECVSYESGLALPPAGSLVTGQRRYEPIRIRKRIDKSSPLLAKAIVKNEVITGTFRFLRTDDRTGETEAFFTVEIRKGRVSSVKQLLPDTLDADTATLPPLEEVAFVFDEITWTYLDGKITFTDQIDIK